MRPSCPIVFMQTSIFNEWIERIYINFKIAFLKRIKYIRNIFKNNTANLAEGVFILIRSILHT